MQISTIIYKYVQNVTLDYLVYRKIFIVLLRYGFCHCGMAILCTCFIILAAAYKFFIHILYTYILYYNICFHTDARTNITYEYMHACMHAHIQAQKINIYIPTYI